MIALDSLKHADFSQIEGDTFAIPQLGAEFKVVLGNARLLGHHHPGATRDAFALLFRGPAGIRVAQGIYRLEHPTLGVMEIFLTQVSANAQGSEFEAIFT